MKPYRSWRRRAAVALPLALALGLGACSSSDSDGANGAGNAGAAERVSIAMLQPPRSGLSPLSDDAFKLSRWATAETSFKFHASCRHTHPAADALLDLMQREGLRQEAEARHRQAHARQPEPLGDEAGVGGAHCPEGVEECSQAVKGASVAALAYGFIAAGCSAGILDGEAGGSGAAKPHESTRGSSACLLGGRALPPPRQLRLPRPPRRLRRIPASAGAPR